MNTTQPLCTNIFTSIHQELREIALLLDDINKDYTLPIDEWGLARRQRKIVSPSNQTVTYQNRRRSSDRIVIEGVH
jgi:hypothetical protein